MRSKPKALVFYIAIIIPIMACTISGSQAPTEEFISVETIVALTLEASNLLPTATQPPSDPDQPPPPDTALPPPPTDTPLPPTLPPTATFTLTPTPTLTPTLSPSDPKQTLGNPDWERNFNSDSHWHTYAETDHKAEIKNGKLLFTMINPLGWSIWTFAAPLVENYYLEIIAQTPNDCPGKERYGIIFQTPKNSLNEGYLLQVACNGEFRLGVYDGSDWDTLIDWGTNSAINAGPNQTNRLGVWKHGNQIAIYINGELVGEVADSSYTGEGKFGVLILSENTNNFTITFDDAAYWTLP